MDERMRFVIRLKDGESMASLCREFGISRKTGYKILERYEQCGREGLTDRHRRPFRYAISFRHRWKRPSWRPSARATLGSTKDPRTPVAQAAACHQDSRREHDPRGS